jgi:hypothetical protein
MFLLVAMFSLERRGWGREWDGEKREERRGKRLAKLLALHTIWVVIEPPKVLLKIETR